MKLSKKSSCVREYVLFFLVVYFFMLAVTSPEAQTGLEEALLYCYRQPSFVVSVSIPNLLRDALQKKNFTGTLQAATGPSNTEMLLEFLKKINRLTYFGFVSDVPDFILVAETPASTGELISLLKNLGAACREAEIAEACEYIVNNSYGVISFDIKDLIVFGPLPALKHLSTKLAGSMETRSEKKPPDSKELKIPCRDFMVKSEKAYILLALDVSQIPLAGILNIKELKETIPDFREIAAGMGPESFLINITMSSPEIVLKTGEIIAGVIRNYQKQLKDLIENLEKEKTLDEKSQEMIPAFKLLYEILSLTKMKAEEKNLKIMVKFPLPTLDYMSEKIIPTLAPIIRRNFVKARADARVKACIANMKVIEGATELYLLEMEPGSITPDRITPEILHEKGYLKSLPVCPEGGVYRIVEAGSKAQHIECSIHGKLE